VARLIPVIDVMGGRVVRAVGGRRSEYKPLVSRLTASTEPAEVARKLLDVTGARELYVADLDAITSPSPILSPNWAVVGRLTTLGAAVWLDYGHRTDFDEAEAQGTGATGFVLGTETVGGVETVYHTWAMTQEHHEVVLSIDLRAGVLQCAWATDPLDAIQQVLGVDIRRVIILDVAVVGERSGPSTGALCRHLRDHFPGLELWTGGGVRSRDDVNHLADAGADAVLVASALHDGALP
jgi:phosphoribosylformimino-5-aminoimidazole carboxamide ribotide isomerase